MSESEKERLISRQHFVQAMRKHQKPTRRIELTKGDPGQTVVTKIGGIPWWPKGLERPHCGKRHPMAFMVQVRLSDVPELGPLDGGLLSFHYCQECTYEGNMSHGWSDCFGNREYSVVVFEQPEGQPADGLGLATESVLDPSCVSLSDVLEVPSLEEIAEELPEDYPSLDSDLDEHVYPGLVHVHRSKIGGWPTWAQSAERPLDSAGNLMIFVCQLDWCVGERASWGGGGYAYLFISQHSGTGRTGELGIQTT